jgi:microcystin-dependent protein
VDRWPSWVARCFGSAAPGFFKLPDARGRVLGTVQQSPGTSYYCVGNSTGEEEHTLTIPEMPTHNHGITDPGHAHAITDPTHSHTYLGVNTQGAMSGGDNVAENNPRPTEISGSSATGISINTNTTGITTQNTGGNLPHNNMQPTLFIGNTFIYSGVRDSRKQYVCTVEEQTIQPCVD